MSYLRHAEVFSELEMHGWKLCPRDSIIFWKWLCWGGDGGHPFIIRYANMMACWKKPWKELSYLKLNIFLSKKMVGSCLFQWFLLQKKGQMSCFIKRLLQVSLGFSEYVSITRTRFAVLRTHVPICSVMRCKCCFFRCFFCAKKVNNKGRVGNDVIPLPVDVATAGALRRGYSLGSCIVMFQKCRNGDRRDF